MSSTFKDPAAGAADDAKWLEIVQQHVASLQYGVVEIIVHDSRVTQIEKTERLRLDRPAGEIRAIRKE
jgi:hypothetical protein